MLYANNTILFRFSCCVEITNKDEGPLTNVANAATDAVEASRGDGMGFIDQAFGFFDNEQWMI
ncbi:MAG TPA: hypothetical protein VLS48_06655 [Anaerolineales bacterium]|nr:hypothetical protein [Anaerolineales bacterium]